jgi:hypothetical protein
MITGLKGAKNHQILNIPLSNVLKMHPVDEIIFKKLKT